jgi:4-amino-4-deoxy-L-arabinose transferase-like glycosyltransferase
MKTHGKMSRRNTAAAHRGTDVSDRPSALATAIVLALILAGAWGLRSAYLAHAQAAPGFAWADPDGYTRQARSLVDENGRWRWNWDCVHYEWNYRPWVLPPGYPVVLSWFALDRGAFPGNAARLHIWLGTLQCLLLFWIAARIHTRMAGLVAAAIGALWLPHVSGAGFFFQEQLFLPLLALAFALAVEAWVRESRWLLFAAAGVAFGLAALTRAMPMYFVPVAALAFVLGSSKRADGWRRAAAFASAFAVVVLPYIVWLSLEKGQLILIDNHGPIEMDRFATSRTANTPGVVDTVRLLASQIADAPARFAAGKVDMLRGMFQVQGGRWLQYYGDAPTARSAEIWKWTAHAGIDLPWIVAALLAPLGIVLARRTREAVFLALWPPLLVVLSVIASYAGARYRSGLEPHLIVLASAVLAGGWRRPSRVWLALALGGSIVMAALVLPQVPRSLAARAQYGIAPWDGSTPGATTTATGAAGLNILPRGGTVRFSLVLANGGGNEPVRAAVWVDRRKAADVLIGATPQEVAAQSAGPGYAYVEIEPLVPEGRPAVRYSVSVSR